MTKRSLLAVAAVLSMLFAVLPMTAAGAAPGDVIINEVDADQAGTDAAEFVELYVEGGGVASLDGMTLVFFNGSTDLSYEVFDLTDHTSQVVVGSELVAGVRFSLEPGQERRIVVVEKNEPGP